MDKLRGSFPTVSHPQILRKTRCTVWHAAGGPIPRLPSFRNAFLKLGRRTRGIRAVARWIALRLAGSRRGGCGLWRSRSWGEYPCAAGRWRSSRRARLLGATGSHRVRRRVPEPAGEGALEQDTATGPRSVRTPARWWRPRSSTSLGNEVEAAHARSDPFEGRRRLMIDWAQHRGCHPREVDPARAAAWEEPAKRATTRRRRQPSRSVRRL